jgi:hypothetical protein
MAVAGQVYFYLFYLCHQNLKDFVQGDSKALVKTSGQRHSHVRYLGFVFAPGVLKHFPLATLVITGSQELVDHSV